MMNNPNPNEDIPEGTGYEFEPPARINFSKPARRFADVQEEIAPQGVRVKVAELEDREITIHSLKFQNGQYGVFAYAICTDANGEIFNTIFSQKVILPKLQNVAGMLPVTTRIVKKEGGTFGRYYDLE